MEESISTPIPNAKSSSDKLFKVSLIIIGLLIVLGLFGNIYLLLKKQNAPIVSVVPNPAEIIATPTIDITASWKTYTNSELGFSIKYPQDILEVKNNGFEPIQKLSNGGAAYMIFFSEYKNPTNLSLQDLVAKTHNYDDEIKKTIKFSSENIGSYTVGITENLLSQDGSKDVFFTKDGQNYLDISLTPLQEDNIIFDQILSTFKFLP